MTKKEVIYDKLLSEEIERIRPIYDKHKGLLDMVKQTGLAKGTITNAITGNRIEKLTADILRANYLQPVNP